MTADMIGTHSRDTLLRATSVEWDAAKRASDLINTLRAHYPWDTLKHCWVAVSLQNGEGDGILYDSKRDAVRHQKDEMRCAYIAFRNLMQGAAPRDMLLFLHFTRAAYKAGFRLPDPDSVDGGPDVAPTASTMDVVREHIRANLPPGVILL